MVDFREVITSEVLADFLTADFGYDLCIWSDGSTEVVESSLVWGRKAPDAPIARVKCPGIGNLDSTVFSDTYAERNESGDYVEIDTGRLIGDLASLICWTCHEGDVTDFMDDLIAKCEESAALPF